MGLTRTRKKLPAAQTIGCAMWLYHLKTGPTDNLFPGKFEQIRTQLTKRREKNEFGKFERRG